MKNNLPTYRIIVDPNDKSGVYAVSVVDQPAIEVDWIKLADEIMELKLSEDTDKQMLYGPLLIPNKLIFRRDEKTGQEYNIVFDAETISIIVEKYNKNKYSDIFNIQHSNRKIDAFLVENWITGKVDKSNDMGFDLPEGTWFGGVKIEDKAFWKSDIKTELVKGFSVEIKAGIEYVELSKIKKINKINYEFMEIKTNEGVSLFFDGELVEGVVLFLDEAMTELAPEGAHMLEDGRVVTLDADGVVLAIANDTPDIEEEDVNLALDPNEIMNAIQPALDEFRSILSELSTRIDALENHEVETPVMPEEYSAQFNELKETVEKLASTAGSKSLTEKSDREEARNKKDEAILNKISFLRTKK